MAVSPQPACVLPSITYRGPLDDLINHKKKRSGEKQKHGRRKASSSHSRQPYKPNDWISLRALRTFFTTLSPPIFSAGRLPLYPHQILKRIDIFDSLPQVVSAWKFPQNASGLPITAPEQHVMSPPNAIYPPLLYTGLATRSLPVRTSHSSPTPADRPVLRWLQRRPALCSQHHFLARARARSHFGFNLSSSECSKFGARGRRAAAVGCRKFGRLGQSL